MEKYIIHVLVMGEWLMATKIIYIEKNYENMNIFTLHLPLKIIYIFKIMYYRGRNIMVKWEHSVYYYKFASLKMCCIYMYST